MHFSCIDIYAHSCLKPFSIQLEAVLKQQNPCTKHEIHTRFGHGFWLKFVDIIGQCHVNVFRRHKMADADEAPRFLVTFLKVNVIFKEINRE